MPGVSTGQGRAMAIGDCRRAAPGESEQSRAIVAARKAAMSEDREIVRTAFVRRQLLRGRDEVLNPCASRASVSQHGAI